MALLRAYYLHQVANGVREDAVFNTRRLAGDAAGLRRDIQDFSNTTNDPAVGTPSGTIITKQLPNIRAELIAIAQQQQQQGQAAPVQPAPAPVQPVAPARQLTPEQQAYAQAGGTRPIQIAELTGDQSLEVWDLYKAYEIANDDVLEPGDAQNPNMPDMRAFWNTIPQNLQDLMKKVGSPQGEIPEDTAIMDSLHPWITNIKQQRQRFANAQQPRIQSNTLIGLGRADRRRNAHQNAKAYLHLSGIPPDMLKKLMQHYGITDEALVGELEGSGIWDTVSNWASDAADSVSGWYNTVANNMPTMSDVRRAVGKIVPDSMSDYVPSGLKRTWGDKAKDLFGFGAQRGHLEDMKLAAELERGAPRTVDMSQGRAEREAFMPFINELNLPAEFLKRRGEVLSGGVYEGNHEQMNDLLPYEMYGGNASLDMDEEATPFKRRIGMPNPFAYKTKMETLPIRPIMASNATDMDDTLVPFQQMFSTVRGGFEREKEKPKDLDENVDPIRITNENWKVYTGKLKAPKYKISS
jgi:hypothetical protein